MTTSCASSTCWARSSTNPAARARTCRRASRSTPDSLRDRPRLVIGSGLDGSAAAVAAEALATWLGAEHEQYGAHSHFGLLLGTDGHRQVVERVRAFLEAHHL